MRTSDQKKLLNAGFTIIKTSQQHIVSHDYEPVIKAVTPDRPEWHIIGNKRFKTKEERDIRFEELLKLETFIAY